MRCGGGGGFALDPDAKEGASGEHHRRDEKEQEKDMLFRRAFLWFLPENQTLENRA